MRRSIQIILCAGVLLALSGVSEVEAFRIPSFRIPTFRMPAMRMPTARMPAMRTQIAPRVHGVKSPQLASRIHGSRLPQQTSKIHRATNFAHKTSGPGKSKYQAVSAQKTKTQALAAKKGDTSHKPTAGKWIDCHASGGVWGHNGSCGHPTFGGGSSTPQAWAYLPLAALPLPQFGSDGTASPLPSPPPPPPGYNNRGSCNSTAGAAFFDLAGNPNGPTLDCGASADDKLADAVNSRLPERTCDGKEYCKEIDCDGHKGTISGAVVSQSIPRSASPFVLIKYEGTKAADLKWVQFIWTEILVRKKPEDKQEAWAGL